MKPVGIREAEAPRPVKAAGFTVVELLLSMAIVATLASIAVPRFGDLVHKARVAEAVGDLKLLEGEIQAYLAANRTLPPDLATLGRDGYPDPWGNPYEYLPFAVFTPGGPGGTRARAPAGARMDLFLVPVNSDFDLYSKGADGMSDPPFTSDVSLDDVVRAGGGVFFGLAEDY